MVEAGAKLKLAEAACGALWKLKLTNRPRMCIAVNAASSATASNTGGVEVEAGGDPDGAEVEVGAEV